MAIAVRNLTKKKKYMTESAYGNHVIAATGYFENNQIILWLQLNIYPTYQPILYFICDYDLYKDNSIIVS